MKRKRIIAFLLSTVMVTSMGLPAAAAESGTETLQNQVLNLKFEDNLNDSSGKGNNGTISLGDAEYVEGISGKALKLNGDKYVNLGTSTDLQPENLTLSFWLKPNSTMSGEQIITWNKNEYNTDGWYVSSISDNQPLLISVGPASGQPYNVGISGMTRSEFFKTGEWTHVVITYDKETKEVKFYRNGTECQTVINYPISGTATGVLGSDATMQKSIGWNGPVYGTISLKAAIDEYQLYNDVATKDEVIALYEEGVGEIDKKAVAQADADALVIASETKGNLSLPAKGKSGSDITWTSLNTSVITDTGVVTRPAIGEDDVTVTLRATISYAGGEAVTKDFTVTVLAQTEISLSPTSVMGNVALADDYLVNASDKEVEYLLSLDSEKFLYEFYKVAGLTPTTSSGYAGWERTNGSNFRGHTFGHYMSALSQAYLSSDDAADKAALKEEIEEAVSGLEQCQNAYAEKYPEHAGYISAFPEGCLKRIDGVDSPTGDDGSLIVPYYNLHKVLAGLIDISKNVDDSSLQERALAVAEGFGEFLYNRLLKLTDKNKMLSIEYGGMNEALYELYNLTGNDHYKTAAQYFDETTLFQQLANNQDVLNGKHANTTIPKLTGALKRYTVLTENQEYYDALTETEKNELDMYLTAAKNFWDIVVEHHTYVTGGNSQSEHFHAADKIGADATKGSYDSALTCETCNTYNMLKLSKALFEVTKDKKYMDYFENTYINAILSSQNPETGTTMYFQPMAPGYNKVFNRPFDEFWCCTGTGMENFSKLGDNIYYTEGSNVYVHMFFSSSYTDAKNNLTITQTANMPNEDTVTFTLAAADGGSIKASTVLRLRRPDWLAGEAVIKVNGKEITLEEENGYYNVKNLKAGDEISYKMPMTVQVYDMPDNPNLVAFKYGPVVLSAGLGSDNIERSAANGILVRVGTLDPDAKTTILMENYTDVEEWKADVEENVVRIEDSEDGQVQFKLNNTDSDELIFTPHYMRYKESYGLYMYLEGEDSQAAQDRILEEKEKLRDNEMSVDYLYTFDNNNYEMEKNLQASDNSGVGVYNDRQYRHAYGGGWFSYDMKVDQSAEKNYLNLTFYSGDKGRTFDISIDGTVVETYKFADAPSDTGFYVHTIEIPKDLVAAADDGKVTVKFTSVSNSLVGGLYGISTTIDVTYDTNAEMKDLSFDAGTLSPKFSGEQTEYTLTIPNDTESVAMKAVPNVGSGLIYVNGILIDDTQDRIISITQDETVLQIVSKAQDHTTSKLYTVMIRKEDAGEKPEILADFDFDDEESGFTNGYAVAKGTYTLQDHDGGKAIYLDGTSDFLEVTKENGESLLTGVKEMTVSFQAKPESAATNWGFYAAPNDDEQTYQQEVYLGALNNKGNLLAERYKNSGARPANASTTVGTSDWHYVTIVYTETETIVYINGEEKARQSSEYGLIDILGNNSILYIGKANWGAGEYYKGLIDNYTIASYAMNADQVKELISGVKVSSLELTAPTKTEYKVGEELDLAGMKVTAKYTDGSTKDVDVKDCQITGYNMNKAGVQTVKVTYGGKSATFEITVEGATIELPFIDVDEEDWYYDAVYYNYVEEIMTGLDKTHFGPNDSLARAQFALILYRINDEPEVDYEEIFPDVEDGVWYTDAILWAADTGVVTGYTDTGKFGPADKINREQMAVMMYRYANYKEYESDDPVDISGYKDAEKVNTFAQKAMEWAVGNGIISGKDGGTVLDPQGNATRAECATIIMRFLEKFEK